MVLYSLCRVSSAKHNCRNNDHREDRNFHRKPPTLLLVKVYILVEKNILVEKRISGFFLQDRS